MTNNADLPDADDCDAPDIARDTEDVARRTAQLLMHQPSSHSNQIPTATHQRHPVSRLSASDSCITAPLASHTFDYLPHPVSTPSALPPSTPTLISPIPPSSHFDSLPIHPIPTVHTPPVTSAVFTSPPQPSALPSNPSPTPSAHLIPVVLPSQSSPVVKCPPPSPPPLAQPPPPPPSSSSSSPLRKRWRGHVCVYGAKKFVQLDCIAIPFGPQSHICNLDTSSWPTQLTCDSSRILSATKTYEQLNSCESEWLVRLAPVDDNGCEHSDPRLTRMVAAMVEHDTAFKIRCAGRSGPSGALFIWGMPLPPYGLSLLALFRQDRAPVHASELTAPAPPLVHVAERELDEDNAPDVDNDVDVVSVSSDDGSSPPAGSSMIPPSSSELPSTGLLSNSGIPSSSVASPVASTTIRNPEPRGRRLWRGHLRVMGQRRHLMIECVAIQYMLSDKVPIQQAAYWPRELRVDSTTLKNVVATLELMNEPSAQWYVRFASVDVNGKEMVDPRLEQLTTVMVDQKLAFEICCDGPLEEAGVLNIWAMSTPPRGNSMLGVFRPHLKKS